MFFLVFWILKKWNTIGVLNRELAITRLKDVSIPLFGLYTLNQG